MTLCGRQRGPYIWKVTEVQEVLSAARAFLRLDPGNVCGKGLTQQAQVAQILHVPKKDLFF